MEVALGEDGEHVLEEVTLHTETLNISNSLATTPDVRRQMQPASPEHRQMQITYKGSQVRNPVMKSQKMNCM